MQSIQTRQPGGFGMVVGAALLWGTIGVATQAIYNLDNTSSLFINLARLLIATPVLLAASWRIGGQAMFRIQRRDLLIMLLAGTLLVISQVAYFAAIRQTGVTIPTLLAMCVSPLVVTCLSVLLKFEALTGRVVIALLCALAGSILLVGLPAADANHEGLILGTLLSLFAAACYGGVFICGRFLAADHHPLQVTTIEFAAGAVVMLLFNLIGGITAVHTAQGWLLVIYLGLLPTAVAYFLLQYGLRTVSATSASIVGMLDPVVAAVLAWVLFGETLAATGLVGACMLILSIFLLSVDRRS